MNTPCTHAPTTSTGPIPVSSGDRAATNVARWPKRRHDTLQEAEHNISERLFQENNMMDSGC